MKLQYKGRGEHIPGVPAQDLSQEDLDRFIASGLFISTESAIENLTRRGLYSVVKSNRRKKDSDSKLKDESQ